MLALGAVLVIGYVLAYADRAERPAVAAMMIGSVTALIASGLLVVAFLDRPYEDHSGSIRPLEMQRTLDLMERGPGGSGIGVSVPCDTSGRPTPV